MAAQPSVDRPSVAHQSAVTFSPLTAAHTSILSLSAAADAAIGTFTVTIAATNGAVGQTTALTLQIVAATPTPGLDV